MIKYVRICTPVAILVISTLTQKESANTLAQLRNLNLSRSYKQVQLWTLIETVPLYMNAGLNMNADCAGVSNVVSIWWRRVRWKL